MKLISLLFFILPLTSLSQSLENQIYKRYFKQQCDFDTATIQKNKISSITKREIYTIGDSVLSNVILSRTTFRADGRPLKAVNKYGGDSSYIQYTYSSLSNLVACSYWASDRGEYGRYIFEYDATILKKMFFYSLYDGSFGSDELELRSADSLVYAPTGGIVTIFHANVENRNSSLQTPKVVSPLLDNKSTIVKGISTQIPPARYSDLMKTPQMISMEATANYLLNKTTSQRNNSKVKKDVWEIISVDEESGFRYGPTLKTGAYYTLSNGSDSLDMRSVQRVDFKNKTIEIQEAYISDPPTNVPSTSYHRIVYHYDFLMRLLWKDEYFADLSNHYPYGHGNESKPVRTLYNYDENGFLKQELTIDNEV